ncbi:SGNH/GDSL hydrolase family protein [Mariluticola halotolerans]|uniref:SGNH/GDSL hydrolase family protein n=1 Tax=Mariluticola halotolerans TaxID=2909283 RepID=UPI0026E35455|nr:SGNH/GDSL hydrolase family protein [Mariluticola halotolerans]UJQ95481.1 SGNH/GDSL hydrolase family protein [Mariluticola halotolerans]
MRSLLCFGDSNTYGQTTADTPDERFGPSERWPGVMRDLLGSRGWLVIEEGLSGRTTVSDDPIEGKEKNGRRYIKPCIQSHKPLDLVILMLGTNDLKARFAKPATEIAMGMGALVQDIKELRAGPGQRIPEIMIVSPPPILEDLHGWESVFEGGRAKSMQLASEFARIADALEVHFFDAGSVVESSTADGFHLDAEGHRRLGIAMTEAVEAIGWPDI